MPTKSDITRMSRNVARALEQQHGLTIKHTSAMSLVASMFGFANTNTMLANSECEAGSPEEGRQTYSVEWNWAYSESERFETDVIMTSEEAKHLLSVLKKGAKSEQLGIENPAVLPVTSSPVSLTDFIADDMRIALGDRQYQTFKDLFENLPCNTACEAP